jgi:hypothetical protein
MKYEIISGCLVGTSTERTVVIKDIKQVYIKNNGDEIVFTDANDRDIPVRLSDTDYSTFEDFENEALSMLSTDYTQSLDLSVSTNSDIYQCNSGAMAFEVKSSVGDTVTLKQSVSGTDWVTTVDSTGEDITETLTADVASIINIYDAPPCYFKLSFTETSGTVIITVR